MSDEIHDHSRVDAFMAARRRAMVLHAVWRPMLAGAAGAALVIGCVWVTLPKFSYREIEVPRVTFKDVTVPNIVARDVEINNLVPHETVMTADEERFASRPEYQSAPYHGRIIASTGGGALSFAGGKNFFPAHLDPVTSQPVFDPEHAFASEEFVGDLGLCRQDPSNHLWDCSALHDGRDIPIGYKPGRPT